MKPYYEDARATLYLGDCLEVMEELADDSIGVVVADPPYSSGTRQAANRPNGGRPIPKRGAKWHGGGIIWDSSFSSFGLSRFLGHAFRQTKRLLVTGGHFYCFIDWRHYPMLTLTLEQTGLLINNLLVWDKGVYALGGNYRSQHELIVFASRGTAQELTRHDVGNVFVTKRVSGGEHPTQKPVDLIRKILDCAPPGVVLDPFMGGGSVVLAAIASGRRAIGIEIEERYCEMAAKRLSQEMLGLSA